MLSHNCIGVETVRGYRTFEVCEGDVREPELAANLLVLSAFSRDYAPVPGTVIGALCEAWSLDLSRLPRALDLTAAFGFWLSEPLDVGHFERLLCVEIVGGRLDIAEVLDNVFVALAVMDAKDIRVQSVVLPMLGAGSMQLSSEEVMASLLPAARKALERHSQLKRIVFVDRHPDRARAMSDEMNRLLDRTPVGFPKGKLIDDLKRDLRSRLDRQIASAASQRPGVLLQLRQLLAREDVMSFELGVMARRFVELIVDDLIGPAKPTQNLGTRITALREIGVASWIQSYMHTLRWLGNTAAHETNRQGQKPPVVDEDDVAICLFCVHRLLDFWVTYGSKRAD